MNLNDNSDWKSTDQDNGRKKRKTMDIRKPVASILGMVVIAASTAVAANAAGPAEFASVSGGDATFTYTGQTSTVTGGLSISDQKVFASTFDIPTAGTLTAPTSVYFTLTDPLLNIGTSTVNTDGTFSQVLGTGTGYDTFTVTDGTTTYLTGAFDGAKLTGSLGSGGAGINNLMTALTDVYYTGGLWVSDGAILTGAGLPGGLQDTYNRFSFSFTNLNPNDAPAVNADGNIGNFTAAGNGQFRGYVTTPEPSTYAAFAFTGIGMMGLMLRARKSRGNMAS